MIVILDLNETQIVKTFNNREIAKSDEVNKQILNKVYSIVNSIDGINIKLTENMNLEDKLLFVNRFNKKNTLLVSFNSNGASPDNICLNTVIGRIRAEKLSRIIFKELIETLKIFPVQYKFNYLHKEYDTHINSAILRKTKCPAILLNTLSISDYENYKLLLNDDFIDEVSMAVAEGIIEFYYKVIHKIDQRPN